VFQRGLDVAWIGLITLGAGVRPLLVTPTAARLLRTYFGGPRGHALPHPLRRWLAGRDKSACRDAFHVARPLVTSNGQGALTIRLRVDGERRLLLLEERSHTASRDALKRLGLTGRQAEVLGSLRAGKTSDEAATILGLSPRTVHHHLEQVYRRLGVENRMAAVRLAVEAVGGPAHD
jgi:DNA-binding CsgD family transcriptional regulator